MTFQANFYDGISARAAQVTVEIEGSASSGIRPSIRFTTAEKTYQYALADLVVQAKLGRGARLIDLPDGGRLEAENIDALELAMPSRTSGFWRILHYVENHLGWVLVSLMLTVLAGWWFLQFGVPHLAEQVAKATPPEMEIKLGEQVLKGLDHEFGYFSASKADVKHKAAISKALQTMCTKLQTCPQYRLEYRDGGMIGANAFALPGGIMVVTDQLIELSESDDEVVAVLTHELGHVSHRHAFRQSLQGVLSGLILASVTGDVSSLGSGLPAALMQMRYSRQHETEADIFALNAMQKTCIPPKAFADILLRLTTQATEQGTEQMGDASEENAHQNRQKTSKKTNQKTSKNDEAKQQKPLNQEPANQESADDHNNHGINVESILSTHPDTLERIKPFQTAQTNCKTS